MCCHTQSPEMQSLGLQSKSERLAKFLITHVGTSVTREYLHPKSGYMVSIVAGPCYRLSTPVVPFTDIVKFIETIQPNEGTNLYYGSWLDEKTFKVYIDVSECIYDREEALAMARSRNEIAIWDVINNCEIRLEY